MEINIVGYFEVWFFFIEFCLKIKVIWSIFSCHLNNPSIIVRHFKSRVLYYSEVDLRNEHKWVAQFVRTFDVIMKYEKCGFISTTSQPTSACRTSRSILLATPCFDNPTRCSLTLRPTPCSPRLYSNFTHYPIFTRHKSHGLVADGLLCYYAFVNHPHFR